MSQRRLRDELHDVFDSISEPAHPALSARIRARLREGQPAGTRAPRLAAAAAFALAAVLVVSLIYASRHGIGSPLVVPGGQPAPAPSATIAPTASPAPPSPGASGEPTPPAAALPQFSCAAQSGGAGQTRPPAGITDVRAAAQTGFDRFVIQFNGPLPQYTVQPQASAKFVQDASGATVTLSGTAGLLVTVNGAQSAGTFTGPTDQKPAGTAVLREARQTGDFEGVVHWGLGLSHATCFRAFTLTGPSRLVVDIASS